jgi:hypothetical protein
MPPGWLPDCFDLACCSCGSPGVVALRVLPVLRADETRIASRSLMPAPSTTQRRRPGGSRKLTRTAKRGLAHSHARAATQGPRLTQLAADARVAWSCRSAG